MKGKNFLALFVCLFSLVAASAQTFLKVNERDAEAFFSDHRLLTKLAVENPKENLPANFKLEILDAADQIIAQSESSEMIGRGRRTVQIPVALPSNTDANALLYYRLRYTVTTGKNSSATVGIIALSEMMPEIYELQVSAGKEIFAGMTLRAHVLAVQPLTRKPVKNVSVKGELALDLKGADDELKITANGKTGDEGYATLDFKIPPNVRLDDGEIKIAGEKNGIEREAEEYLNVSGATQAYLNFDKPIYQPNQKFFARALYLNPLKRPLADENLTFEITDEDDETIYEQMAKTSRFGAAHIAWQIPADLKLGRYEVEVSDGSGETVGKGEFKITRYDLPTFSVNAEPRRTFYLPDERTAEIAVSADYLFGKPVAAGKVRVVREMRRRWNYEEQEYESEEAQTVEGTLDADGKFVARMDLSQAHETLRSDNWKRFEDLHFAAYLTDATTNRTAQKRFDVRISKEAIHVYLVRYFDDVNPSLPLQLYISTFYADGTPAPCNLRIKGSFQETANSATLAESKTNADGAGKIELRIPEKPFPEAGDRFYLNIAATDKKGGSGTLADSLELDAKSAQIRIKTDKTIYLPNENIEAEIRSTENDRMIFVDVLKNSSVVYSKRLKLNDNRAALSIPFRPDFKGELMIAAYFQGEDDLISRAKTIIYPSPNNLNLEVKSLKTVYRPNEEASISFKVRGGAGENSEAALGIVVLDQAVEKIAETERLPDNYRDVRRLLGTADSFGKFTRRDLDNLDTTKPINENTQLAAEFLLVNKSYTAHFFESDSFQDDFSRIYKDYFTNKLQFLENALNAAYDQTGEYPRDENDLRRIALANGINFDDLRDAWGTAYKIAFRTEKNFLIVSLITASADKKFDTEDDFSAKEMRFGWFAATQKRLEEILNTDTQNDGKIPQTVEDLQAIWKRANFDFDALRDDFNRPLYLTAYQYNRSTQKAFLENIGNLDGAAQQVVRAKIVSQDVIRFEVRSAGADGIKNNFDDFDLDGFTIVTAEKDLNDTPPLAKISKETQIYAGGAISGTLLDPQSAVIPGATVTAVSQVSEREYSVTTDENGFYLLKNLPSGKYKVSANSPGFQTTTVENVVVSSMNLIKLDFYLYVAGATMTVDVTADSSMTVESTNSSLKTSVKRESKSISGAINSLKNQSNATPRVREYFPETLFWSPDIITDRNGAASLKFKLADSLTTWKLYAVASNEAGEINLIEKEIKTFQPFFAELDPPRILTEGDEIALPVPVRNYTNKRRKVAVSMAKNDWSRSLNGAAQNLEVAANDSENAIFSFRAVAPVENGRQKVTALAKGDGDAIEKFVSVKPNGRETVETASKFFRGAANFDVDFPAESFPATRKTQIKIYPNMFAHVAESIEGLLQRPHGCGEQTTSSTYPNLMILKIEKETSKVIDPNVKAQAQIYLREGYERLLNYQTPSGGFSYWGKTDAPNVALTVYVLRFLNDAENYVAVDEKVTANAREWLLKQQEADGSWKTSYVDTNASTAYVANSLARQIGANDTETKAHLNQAFEFLKKRLPEIKDAFALASFALAAARTGEAESGKIAAEKLNSLAQTEKGNRFWTTASTPFHGWGETAKIETTALAVQALLRMNEARKYETPIAEGLAFLLKSKDKYGVWYSTQTTVNVLDALIATEIFSVADKGNAAGKTEIFVNGIKAGEFSSTANTLANPLIFDVSELTTELTNRVEIKNAGGSSFTQAQIVSVYYLPWRNSPADSRYFDLKVNYDRLTAKIGEEITCAVSIARRDHRYGMVLAEIGIPPGADIDRNSLETAKANGDFSRYDILPDKILVYFWSQTAPTKFKFKFKPRYGINAQTAPSIVYDYYNSEAQATAAPLKFTVK